MTSLGQKNKAGSISTTLASDQGALPITDNSGSLTVDVADGNDVALGATTDAAVDTNITGTVSGKLRGMVKLMVDFLSRFPVSLGQKSKAGSVSVTLASDQSKTDVLVVSEISYGGGTPSGNVDLLADTLYCARPVGGTYVPILDAGDASPYFASDDPAFDASLFEVVIPLGSNGRKDIWIHIVNNFDVSIGVTMYGALHYSYVMNVPPSVDYYAPLMTVQTIAAGAFLDFGKAGTTLTNRCDWPFEAIVLQIKPASDPSSGSWDLMVAEQ